MHIEIRDERLTKQSLMYTVYINITLKYLRAGFRRQTKQVGAKWILPDLPATPVFVSATPVASSSNPIVVEENNVVQGQHDEWQPGGNELSVTLTSSAPRKAFWSNWLTFEKAIQTLYLQYANTSNHTIVEQITYLQKPIQTECFLGGTSEASLILPGRISLASVGSASLEPIPNDCQSFSDAKTYSHFILNASLSVRRSISTVTAAYTLTDRPYSYMQRCLIRVVIAQSGAGASAAFGNLALELALITKLAHPSLCPRVAEFLLDRHSIGISEETNITSQPWFLLDHYQCADRCQRALSYRANPCLSFHDATDVIRQGISHTENDHRGDSPGLLTIHSAAPATSYRAQPARSNAGKYSTTSKSQHRGSPTSADHAVRQLQSSR
nr:hypothetical protein Iba_chr13cCG11020 [Ipomoea batatas]